MRNIPGPASEGTHRLHWDLRDPSASLPAARAASPDEDDDDTPRGSGPLVPPGLYTARLFQRVDGKFTALADGIDFKVSLDTQITTPAADVKEQVAFHRQVLKLQRALVAANGVAGEVGTRLDQIRRAIDASPVAGKEDHKAVRDLIAAHREIQRSLRGDTLLRARNESVPESISDRVSFAAGAASRYIGKPTGTQRESYAIGSKEFSTTLANLKKLVETDLPGLEKKLNGLDAPFTPGRLPEWK